MTNLDLDGHDVFIALDEPGTLYSLSGNPHGYPHPKHGRSSAV
jgi:hypothetical protein